MILRSLLAVLIACMGLFGLSSITIEKRIKEIGIRKVLGASIMQLFLLLSKNFTLMILVAFIISVPVSLYFMSDWLENFAFHIGIEPKVYIITGILSVFIALITISYKTISTTTKNPSETLKYE